MLEATPPSSVTKLISGTLVRANHFRSIDQPQLRPSGHRGLDSALIPIIAIASGSTDMRHLPRVMRDPAHAHSGVSRFPPNVLRGDTHRRVCDDGTTAISVTQALIQSRCCDTCDIPPPTSFSERWWRARHYGEKYAAQRR